MNELIDKAYSIADKATYGMLPSNIEICELNKLTIDTKVADNLIYLKVPTRFKDVYSELLKRMSDYGVDLIKDCTSTCNGENKNLLVCWNMFQAACAANEINDIKRANFIVYYIIKQLGLDITIGDEEESEDPERPEENNNYYLDIVGNTQTDSGVAILTLKLYNNGNLVTGDVAYTLNINGAEDLADISIEDNIITAYKIAYGSVTFKAFASVDFAVVAEREITIMFTTETNPEPEEPEPGHIYEINIVGINNTQNSSINLTANTTEDERPINCSYIVEYDSSLCNVSVSGKTITVSRKKYGDVIIIVKALYEDKIVAISEAYTITFEEYIAPPVVRYPIYAGFVAEDNINDVNIDDLTIIGNIANVNEIPIFELINPVRGYYLWIVSPVKINNLYTTNSNDKNTSSKYEASINNFVTIIKNNNTYYCYRTEDGCMNLDFKFIID